MKRTCAMNRLWLLGATLLLVTLGSIYWSPSVTGHTWGERAGARGASDVLAWAGMGGMGPGGMMGGGPMGRQGPEQFASNGERIYATGVSERSGPIPRAGGPMWIRMMGGGCAVCHGPDGRGGVPVMMGTAIPPDIRYPALTTGSYEPGGKATPYTDTLIQRAVTQGLDADGKPLDATMPRWQMSDADFADLLTYLKTLR